MSKVQKTETMAGPSLVDVLRALASSSDEEDLSEWMDESLRNESKNNLVTATASNTNSVKSRPSEKCHCTSLTIYQGATTRSMSRRGRDCPFMNTRTKKKHLPK